MNHLNEFGVCELASCTHSKHNKGMISAFLNGQISCCIANAHYEETAHIGSTVKRARTWSV